MRCALLVVIAFAAACSGSPGGPTMNNKVDQGIALEPQHDPVESADVLAREPIANTAQIKHILIGWAETNTGQDPRAAKRTKKDAAEQVRAILGQIQSGANFEQLMKQYSEDPGSASSGIAYTVSPEAQLVIEFKQLGLRLRVGEVGVVKSDFGFHIMKRVQ